MFATMLAEDKDAFKLSIGTEKAVETMLDVKTYSLMTFPYIFCPLVPK